MAIPFLFPGRKSNRPTTPVVLLILGTDGQRRWPPPRLPIRKWKNVTMTAAAMAAYTTPDLEMEEGDYGPTRPFPGKSKSPSPS